MADLLEQLRQQHEISQPLPPPPLFQRIRWDRLGASLLLLLVVGLACVEVALRLTGPPVRIASFSSQSEAVRLAVRTISDQTGHSGTFRQDPWLLWTYVPGTDYEGSPVLSQGYLGIAPGQPPIPGALRILAAGGDLGTGTLRPWPVVLARLARISPDGPRLEVANVCTPGYSTVQTLRRITLESDFRASVIIVNEPLDDSAPSIHGPDILLGWRGIFGWLEQIGPARLVVYQHLRGMIVASGADRVAPETARRLWLDFLNRAAEDRVAVLILTHPARSTRPWTLDWEEILATHRQTHPDSRVDLLDLSEDFLRRESQFLLTSDRYHLSPPGHNLVARLVMGRLLGLNLISPAQFRSAVESAWYDSSAPDRPQVQWRIQPSHHNASVGTTYTVSLSIRNTGNTRLLSSHVVPLLGGRERVDAGGVQVIARHVTEGAPDTPPMAPLSLGRDLLPNEETRWEAVLTAPDRPGDYAIEFALESRSIGLLEHFGCAITTATLAVR